MRRLLVVMLSLTLAACAQGVFPDQAATGRVQTPTLATSAASASGADTLPQSPDGLLHLDGSGVESVMGKPEFVWSEADAQMWRYRGKACFVDVFLYPGAGVTYVDVRGAGLDTTARDACFRRLVKDHAEAS